MSDILALSGESLKADRDPQSLEGATAVWPLPIEPVVDEATASFILNSTSGPNHPYRQTKSPLPRVEAEGAPFPLLPGLQLTAYIDCGGMGHVYLAQQETPNRTVAVKIAFSFNRAGLVPRERFDREIQALAAISHPNIMPIYVAGDWHGFPYYSMRYMPGGSLSKQLARFSGKTAEIVTLVRKVVSGLQVLHEAKIIHRDLKPHNILLDVNDEPVIADFGLAKWMDGSQLDLTLTDSAVGTKYYMPPEQVAGDKENFGPPSDVWALGVVLYELLAGQRPFREDAGDVFFQIRTAVVVIPESVPVGLATILRRCLQKCPADRYPSAAELGVDLDRWLSGKTVAETNPVPKPPKRRRRSLILAGVAAALVAVASLALVIWSEKKKSIAERLRAGETVTLIGEKGMPAFHGEPIPGAEGQFFLADNGYCSLIAPGLAVRLLSTEKIDVPVEVSVECAFSDGLLAQNPINTNIYPYAGLIFGYRTTFLKAKPLHHYYQLIQSYEILRDASTAELASIQRMHWSSTESDGFENLESSSRPMPAVMPGSASLNWKRMAVELRPAEIAASMNGMALKPLRFAGPLWNMGLDPNTEPRVGSGIGIATFLSQAYFRNLKIKPQPQ